MGLFELSYLGARVLYLICKASELDLLSSDVPACFFMSRFVNFTIDIEDLCSR